MGSSGLGWFDGMTDVPWKAPLNALTRMASGSLMLASNAMFWVRDNFRAQMAKASEDLDAWNRANFGPDAETMGKATQIIYGLVNILPEIAMYMSGTGALARLAIKGIGAGYKIRNTSLAVSSALFGTDMGIAERNRLINEGVDRDTANKAGLVSGAANALGVFIPAFLGASRTMSAIYGATSNVGLNMAELKGIQYILEKQDYSELSKQYDLNLVDSTVSLVMGAAMGATFWRNPIDIKYERAHERLYETYKVGLEKTGKFTDKEIDAQVKLAAKGVVNLARINNIAPDKIVDEFAPKITFSEDYSTMNIPNEYAMKVLEKAPASERLKLEVNDWIRRIDELAEKPRQPVLMLKQTPVVMHLVGADFLELRAHPHFFDGMFPNANKSNPDHHVHTEMDKEMVGQIPEALTNPIAITRDERNNSYVFVLDLKNKKGDAVVVPVRFSATGRYKANINLVKTAFGRDGKDWLELQGNNNALRYVNTEKLKRLEEKPGAISLRAPNALTNGTSKFTNSDGTTVLTQNDLVKAREKIKQQTGQEVYQIGYHGTSYLFDTFTLAHIGEGVGGQAHGYGLYFALARMKAERYREMLAGHGYKIGTKEINDFRTDLENSINKASSAEEKQRLQNRLEAFDEYYAHNNVDDVKTAFDEGLITKEAYEWFKSEVQPEIKGEGHLYTVDIPNDDVLLREEHAFNNQPKKVQAALRKVFKEVSIFAQKNEIYREQWYKDAMKQLDYCSESFFIPVDVVSAIAKLAKEEGPQIFADEKKVLKSLSKEIDEAVKKWYLQDEETKAYYDKIAGKDKNGIDLARQDIIGESELAELFHAQLRIAEWKYPYLLKVKGGDKFEFADDITGRKIYEQIAEFVGGEKEASVLLNKYGIKGIRYTGKQDGECAVIFDDKAIKILEYFQREQNGIRGSFNEGTNTIKLTPELPLD